MESFLRFFDQQRDNNGYALTVYYSSIVDWTIQIGFKTNHVRHGENIVYVQHCDIDYAFAKAETDFKDWLTENQGGY